VKPEEIKQFAVNYATEQMGQDELIDPMRKISLSDMLADFHSKIEEYKEKRAGMSNPVMVDCSQSIYSLSVGGALYRCPTCGVYELSYEQPVCNCGQILEW
jgi:hypothetical protein